MSGEGTVEQVLAGERRWCVLQEDCRALLPAIPDSTLHSCVCDPPYELGFMGRKWDASGIAYDVAMWRQVLRALKPGGYLLAFGGTRTYHRMACAIEDAGFDVRDCIVWMYASGFPKSLDVSKAIDQHFGNERPDRTTSGNGCSVFQPTVRPENRGTPIAAAAAGWGTALKPAIEPVIVARKPLEGTVATNWLEHGTGAMNIDASRIDVSEEDRSALANAGGWARSGYEWKGGVILGGGRSIRPAGQIVETDADYGRGRWPANVIHDGSPEVLEQFARYGDRPSGASVGNGGKIFGAANGGATHDGYPGDDGSAARFFFCAKASRAERELGCAHLPARSAAEATHSQEGAARLNSPRTGAGRTATAIRNTHPTVKPLALLRYLQKLVTPPGGIVLDPFCGSGTGGMSALLEGFRYVGMELMAEHMPIALARIRHVDGYGWQEETESGPTIRQQGLPFGR